MTDRENQLSATAATLLNRGEVVLEALRSVAKEAGESQVALLHDAKPLFDEVGAVVEKNGIGDAVQPALDCLAQAWFGVLQRQVRFFDLLSEIETIHEELFALFSGEKV